MACGDRKLWAVMLLVLLVGQVVAGSVFASCYVPNPYICLCQSTSRIVVDATVLDAESVPVVVLIEGIHNPAAESTGLAVGATASADMSSVSPSDVKYAVGDRILAQPAESGGLSAVVHIGKDGQVTCNDYSMNLLTVGLARSIMSSGDCGRAMSAGDTREFTCNDTMSVWDCTAGRTGSLGWLLLAVAAAFVGVRRRAKSG